MLLSPIVDGLKSDLTAAAAVGGDETQRAAGILVGALEAALRFRLLDVLQEAADELASSLPGLRVDVQLSGRDPMLVASLITTSEAGAHGSRDGGDRAEDFSDGDRQGGDDIARITLRLPETLKSRVEQAALRKGVSVNTWLVGAASQALVFDVPKGRPGKRISGFARG